MLLGWLASLAPGGLLAVAYWPPADGQHDAAWRALTDPALFKNLEALPLYAPCLFFNLSWITVFMAGGTTTHYPAAIQGCPY